MPSQLTDRQKARVENIRAKWGDEAAAQMAARFGRTAEPPAPKPAVQEEGAVDLLSAEERAEEEDVAEAPAPRSAAPRPAAKTELLEARMDQPWLGGAAVEPEPEPEPEPAPTVRGPLLPELRGERGGVTEVPGLFQAAQPEGDPVARRRLESTDPDDVLYERMIAKAPPATPPALPLAEGRPASAGPEREVAPVSEEDLEKRRAKMRRGELLEELTREIMKESPAYSEAQARVAANDRMAELPISRKFLTDEAISQLTDARGEAVAAEALRIQDRHRGDPKWEGEEGAELAQRAAILYFMDKATPRDIENRPRPWAQTREQVAARTGLTAAASGFLPRVYKTEAESDAELEILTQLRRARQEQLDRIYAGLDPLMPKTEREAEANKQLVEWVKSLRADNSPEGYHYLALTIAPDALPPEDRTGKVAEIVAGALVTTDTKTGRVVETPLAQVLRGLYSVNTLANEIQVKTLYYDADESGAPMDPGDWAYAVDQWLGKTLPKDYPVGSFEVPASFADLAGARARGKPRPPNRTVDISIPSPGQAAIGPSTLPRPFQPTTRNQGPRRASESGSFLTDFGVSVHEGRMLSDEYKSLPRYQQQWKEWGLPWMPTAQAFTMDVLVPLSWPYKLARLGLGKAGVAALTMAEGAPRLRAAAEAVRIVDSIPGVPAGPATALGGVGTKLRPMADVGLRATARTLEGVGAAGRVAKAASTPVATVQKAALVSQVRLAERGLDNASDIEKIGEMGKMREVAAENLAREVVGPMTLLDALEGGVVPGVARISPVSARAAAAGAPAARATPGAIPAAERTLGRALEALVSADSPVPVPHDLNAAFGGAKAVEKIIEARGGTLTWNELKADLQAYRTRLQATPDSPAANLVDLTKGGAGLPQAIAKKYANRMAAEGVDDFLGVEANIAAATDLTVERLANLVPENLSYITPTTVVPTRLWNERGAEAMALAKKNGPEGTWSPDGLTFTLTKLDGQAVDNVKLTLDQYNGLSNLAKTKAAESVGIPTMVFQSTGPAAKRAAVPEARRPGVVDDVRDLARGAEDIVTARLLLKGSEGVKKWAAGRQAALHPPVAVGPIAAQRATQRIAEGTARIHSNILTDLNALRREGIVGPEAVNQLAAREGAESIGLFGWEAILNSHFGREGSGPALGTGAAQGAQEVKSGLLSLQVARATENGTLPLTGANLAAAIKKIRLQNPSLEGIGVLAGPDLLSRSWQQDNVFATLLAWVAQKRYGKLVDEAFMIAEREDPTLLVRGPEFSDALVREARLNAFAFIPETGSNLYVRTVRHAAEPVAEAMAKNQAVGDRLVPELLRRYLKGEDGGIASVGSLEELAVIVGGKEGEQIRQLARQIEAPHKAWPGLGIAAPEAEVVAVLQAEMAEALQLVYWTEASRHVSYWDTLIGANTLDRLQSHAPRFARIPGTRLEAAFSQDIVKDIEQIQADVSSGVLQQALGNLMVKDPSTGAWALRIVDDLLDSSRRVMINGMLGGIGVPTPRFHGNNYFSAGLIMAVTLGEDTASRVAANVALQTPGALARGAYNTARGAVAAVSEVGVAVSGGRALKPGVTPNVVNRLAKRFSLPQLVGKAPDEVVITDPAGRQWTRRAFDDAVARNDILFSQATLELTPRSGADLMVAAQVTPSMERAGWGRRVWRWFNPANKGLWAKVGEESDNLFRKQVFGTALAQGKTEREAAELAKAGMLNYSALATNNALGVRWSDIERNTLRQGVMFWSFRRQMALEVANAVVRRPETLRRLMVLNNAVQQEEADYYLPGYAQAYLGLTTGPTFDSPRVGSVRGVLADPTMDAVGSWAALSNLILSLSIGEADTADAWAAIRDDLLYTPAIDLGSQLLEPGDEIGEFGRVPPRHVAALQEMGVWPWFRASFHVDPASPGRRYPGYPTDVGEVQWTFKDRTQHNRYLKWMFVATRAGARRAADDYSQLAYTTGLIGQGDRKRFDLGPAVAPLYGVGLTTPLSVPTHESAEDRIRRRILKDLKDAGADKPLDPLDPK